MLEVIVPSSSPTSRLVLSKHDVPERIEIMHRAERKARSVSRGLQVQYSAESLQTYTRNSLGGQGTSDLLPQAIQECV
jgi:hypothetical protein